MKINEEKIFNRYALHQSKCQQAIDLAKLDDDILINDIKIITALELDKRKLKLWAVLLNRFDDLLAEAVEKEFWILKLDQPSNEHLIQKIIAILEFTGKLIERSEDIEIYGSWEHIMSLFSTSNLDVLHELLDLIYKFMNKTNYFSTLDQTSKSNLLHGLSSISQDWGGNQTRFRLEDCFNNDDMADQALSLQIEFMEYLSQYVGDGCGDLTREVLFDNPQSPSEAMENLFQKFNDKGKSVQMIIFARLRSCFYFAKPHQRKSLVHTRLQAISTICLTNGYVEEIYLSLDIVGELVGVLERPGPGLFGIKARALRTITAIIENGKLKTWSKTIWHYMRDINQALSKAFEYQKPNTIQENLHRNNNEHNPIIVDDNEIIMPEQPIVESKEISGPSDVLFSNENNAADFEYAHHVYLLVLDSEDLEFILRSNKNRLLYFQ